MAVESPSDVSSAAGSLAGVDVLEEFERSNVGLGNFDLWPRLAELRKSAPVRRGDVLTEMLGASGSMASMEPATPCFDVFTYEGCMRVLHDPESFSHSIYADRLGATMGRNILMMDGPEHRRHRAILTAAFSPKTIAEWRVQLMEPLAEEHVDSFVGAGRADLMLDIALTYPVTVIHRVLGLPRDRLMELHTLAVALLLNTTRPAIALQASARLGEILALEVERRRRDPGEDIITVLVNGEVEGERLSSEEVIGFLRVLMPAGGETTTRNLGSLMAALLTDRRQLELVLERPELMRQAVEESLRWEPPTTVQYRRCARDSEVLGVSIRAGSIVNVWTGSGSHDETVFEDPERFDVLRPPKQHLSFSSGAHICLGMHMARAESATAAAALLRRLPNLRLDPDAEPPQVHGSTFRSPANVRVVFDAP